MSTEHPGRNRPVCPFCKGTNSGALLVEFRELEQLMLADNRCSISIGGGDGAMLAGLDGARMLIFVVQVAVWFPVNYCSAEHPGRLAPMSVRIAKHALSEVGCLGSWSARCDVPDAACCCEQASPTLNWPNEKHQKVKPPSPLTLIGKCRG